MTCSRCHRLVGITWDECFEPCVVTSVYCDCGNLVSDEGKNNCVQNASVLQCCERC